MNNSQWAAAPAELIQELGLAMGAREWAAARLVCRHWRANICARVQALDLDLESDGHRWCMVTAAARRLFPKLRSLALLVGARAGPPAEFRRRMEELALVHDVKELEVRYVPILAPTIGVPLGRVGAACAELLGLEVLKLCGGPTPPVECVEALSRLRRLRELEILPGDYGVPAGEAWGDEAIESPHNYGIADDHAGAMEKITSLTSLVTKVKPEVFTQAGLASLAGLPELKSLVVYDAELPSSSLVALAGATKLETLQVGICDLDDLSPLKILPKLLELYFDACSIAELRRLPAAMRVAGFSSLTRLTGLYSIDQVFSSQAEFDVLSELDGLKELVLEGPFYRPPNWEDNPDTPLPADLSRMRFNLTGLSKLTALEVLQFDKRDAWLPEDLADVAPLDADDGWFDVNLSPDVVRVLAAGWHSLTALDLYNITPLELPAESVAELTRLSNLRSLGIASRSYYFASQSQQKLPKFTRQLGWWQLPPRLHALSLGHFDLTITGDEAWHGDAASIGRHFSRLSSLALHDCALRDDIFLAAVSAMADSLISLSLCHVYGVGADGLAALPLLTTLTTLRYFHTDDSPAFPLASLAPLRLKQLKLRLCDMDDLEALGRMTSLFVLNLSAHLNADGVPDSPQARQLFSRVEATVRSLPYADVELVSDRPNHP